MAKGFSEIAKQSGLNSTLLYRTPSGIGILYPDQVSIETKKCILAFTEKKEIIESLLESQTINHKVRVTIIKFLPKWTIKLFKKMKHVVRR